MSEFENMENELDPALQHMLKAYAGVSERDPESARRNQERFVVILNTIFEEPAKARSAGGWSSIFNLLRETLANSFRARAVLAGFIFLILLAVFLFGGVGITVYAANSSLPGDTLYPLKTTLENARAELAADPADQARLYTEFAGRRLSEAQSLVNEARDGDIARAASEFERDIREAVSAIDSLSQTDPGQAVIVRAEIAVILRGYHDILKGMLAGLPGDLQPAIQSAINTSGSAAELLEEGADDDFNDDEDDEIEGETDVRPSPQPGNTSQPTPTPQSLPAVGETVQAGGVSPPLPAATVLPPVTATPVPPATQAPADTGPVIQGGDGTCQGSLGAVTVENLEVPQGASCTLDGTRVQGNIFIRSGASLTARGVTVIGNIQAEGASFVEVLAGSTVGGSIQLKQGGSARVESVSVNGDIQFESNNGVLSAAGNQVGGNIQVFQNGGTITVTSNIVNGNLQCKENNPAPAGGNNVVQGNKEDQCSGL